MKRSWGQQAAQVPRSTQVPRSARIQKSTRERKANQETWVALPKEYSLTSTERGKFALKKRC
jgi:hypothetical protein